MGSGLILMLFMLLRSSLVTGMERKLRAPEHFLLQNKIACHFANGTAGEVRLLFRRFYDRQEIARFDSRCGEFEAVMELARKEVERWNSRPDMLAFWRASVDRFCRHNYEVFVRRKAIGRKGSSSHSLRYFVMSVSDPGQAVPQFHTVGYVDDQPFVSYDVAKRKVLPQVPWMEEFGKDNPDYFDTESQIEQGNEAGFRQNLATLMGRYNQSHSTGVHTWQAMYGCVVGRAMRPTAGYQQYGYDGEDFVSFDKKTLTWTATTPEAQMTKRKWEVDRAIAQRWKAYLEEVCVEWLRRYLEYGKETLQRTVPPTVKVARKKHQDGQETLVCRAHGFYPKEIEVTWTKDSVDQGQDTLTWEAVPNSDGTYHKWRSIDVDPKDRDRYRCHVEHDSLEKTLDLAWEEPVNMGLIVGVLVGVLLAAAALVGGVIIYIQKRNRPVGGYKATPGSEQRSDTSIQGSEQGSDTSVQAPSAVA